MISLRTRFDIHRDLGQWSLNRYAMELGYEPGNEQRFIDFANGKRELTTQDATFILTHHHFLQRGDELPSEIVAELEKLATAG